jgi:DNA-binding NtrC family response regulator
MELDNKNEGAVAVCNPPAVLKPVVPMQPKPAVAVQPPPAPQCPPGCVAFKIGAPLAEIERSMILRTMELTRGNRTRAAKMLGISVRTLYTKLLRIDQENAGRAATPTAAMPKI